MIVKRSWSGFSLRRAIQESLALVLALNLSLYFSRYGPVLFQINLMTMMMIIIIIIIISIIIIMFSLQACLSCTLTTYDTT